MKKTICIIYMAQCTLKRELIYIGKTHQKSLQERIIQHENSARKGSPTCFHKNLLDYGFRNWEWNIIHKCSIENEIEEEKRLIKKLGATPIDLLNTTHGQKVKNKAFLFSKEIIDRTRNNKAFKIEKSQLGKQFLRQAGKLKPVMNLKSKKIYESLNQASIMENVPVATIRLSCLTGKMLSDSTRYAYLDLDDAPILTEGHNENTYTGQRVNIKRIKNLINGKIFDSITEASQEYSISDASIQGCASGKYSTLKNKWVFCYLDKNGTELLTEKHKKGLEKLKKAGQTKYVAWYVDDLEMKNLFYFKTLDEISQKLEIKNKGHIKSVCDGKRSHVEKWRVAYFDNSTEKPVLTDTHKQKSKKIIRKIICLNDNKIFQNGAEAGIFYKISAQQITKCAGGHAKSVYCSKERLRFAFLDDNNKPILTDKHSESLTAKGKSRIQLLKTGQVFNSLAEYSRVTGVSLKTAKRYSKDPSINLLGFEFIELN
jgi:hypothetical protein